MKQRIFSMNMVFTLLQGITIALCVFGLLLVYFPLSMGVQALIDGPAALGFSYAQWLMMLLVGFASVALVSLCCAAALIAFFLMCGRLKRGTAFTRKNQRTMGFIALCSLIAGVTLIAATVLCGLLGAAGIHCLWMVLGAFLFLAVAAVAWALSLLVRRAVTLQDEADLTV